MPPRTGLIVAALLAAFVLAGGVLALTVPTLLKDMNSAQEPTRTEHVRPADRPGADANTERAPAAPATRVPETADDPADDGPNWTVISLILFGVSSLLGFIALGVMTYKLIRRRLHHRDLREYDLYELHLSMHDEAKSNDLEEMIESIANVIRQFPEVRARDGQPYVAFELHYGPTGNGELEWTIAVRCETKVVAAIDAAIAAAYPDVRIGHHHGEAPQPIGGKLPVPGYVLRYRKARPFVYALNSESDERDGSPPLEAIAQAQVALGAPSSVRIQLTPAPSMIEDWARRRFQRYENKLVRSESWGMNEAGLRGSLNRQEMTAAKRTQNRSMFWMEVQVAAETRELANRVGSVLQSSRGDNRLHRRWMVWPLRLRMYRERFPTAYPPLWPALSLRSLTSAAEVAHMLELPSARMKTVPVRRLALPRLPAPPEIERAQILDDASALPPAVGLVNADMAVPLPPEA